MQVKVEPVKGSILSVLRPKVVGATTPKLLIYTRDGKIPMKIIPDTGEISEALGNRFKANFVCTIDGPNIILGKEVYCQN